MSGRKTEKLVGKGISERRRSFRHFDVDNLEHTGALKVALQRMAEASKDPWARIAPVIEGAQLQLTEIEQGATSEDEFKEREGMGWYLRQLIMHAKLVRHHIEAGNASWAAIEALAVGELISEMGIKHKWERYALAGQRSSEGASEGGRLRGASDKIADRRLPLIACYQRKRAENWAHETAVRYAVEHAHREADIKGYSIKQARRILDPLE